jgi:hypothetical protein
MVRSKKKFSRFLKLTITVVKLSKLFSIADCVKIWSVILPVKLWIVWAWELVLISLLLVWLIVSHVTSKTCWFERRSKIPSHPKTRKSWNSGLRVNYEISGCAIITPSRPPYFESLASISPKVRETDSLPGNTLWGPHTTYPWFEPCTYWIDWV